MKSIKMILSLILVMTLVLTTTIAWAEPLESNKQSIKSSEQSADIQDLKIVKLTPEEYFVKVSQQTGISVDVIRRNELAKMKESYIKRNPHLHSLPSDVTILSSYYYEEFSRTETFFNTANGNAAIKYGIYARIYSAPTFRVFDEILNDYIEPYGSGTHTWDGNHASDINPSDQTQATIIGSGNVVVEFDYTISEALKADFLAAGFSITSSGSSTIYFRKWVSINYTFHV